MQPTKLHEGLPGVALVGSPNVGKSVVFNNLTGAYATVSNYPGTTVEVTRGRASIGGVDVEVVDTPGMYSLLSITEEERVARRLLIEEGPRVVVHVVDAKNIERMLAFTISLLEAGLPVVLVLNIMDEAQRLGMKIDPAALAERLGIPVIPAISTRGVGMKALREAIARSCLEARPTGGGAAVEHGYDPRIAAAQAEIAGLLQAGYGLAAPAVALLLLQGDEEMERLVRSREGPRYRAIREAAERARRAVDEPLAYSIGLARQAFAATIAASASTPPGRRAAGPGETLSRLAMNPVTGVPVLLAVLYFGLYRFVGGFGAGTMVDFLEVSVFERFINPVVNALVLRYVPYPALQDLLARDYGIVTLGVRYAVAIILPIVGTFFIAFSIIEDSGYLPRLALLVDRLFKRIGLNGRAVIPMTLGFGCDTMATIVSRTLESRRERVIATLLLALAIPCSAQLGVILALLSAYPGALAVWAGVVLLVLLAVGYLTARLLPGPQPSFYMEVPPLRFPRLANVLTKTYTRMYWYLSEVLPLFIYASVIIWLGKLTGAFDAVISAIDPVVRALGLPSEAATAFVFGFFRRDYGAAGLYDIRAAMTPGQMAVAAVTLTLFVPCIAQFSVMLKERGFWTAVAIAAFIIPVAFGTGFVLNLALTALGVTL